MDLEVLLSVMNLNKSDLDKMNIISKCTVINQCSKREEELYKNFHIYSYNEKGVSVSRNRGLDHAGGDIILLCDDDIVYEEDYEKKVLDEFAHNTKADVILFNFKSPNRYKRPLKKRKRLHIYNSLNYATYNIAFRKKSVQDTGIRFNTSFGPGAKFNNGSDTIFLRDIYRSKLKVYSSPEWLGTVYNTKSTWFTGYDEKFFFNKGALFTAIYPPLRHILIQQYLIRHKKVCDKIGILNAYKEMLKGSKEYLRYTRQNHE